MTSAHLSATDHARLLRRGFALEYATLGWNVAGIAVLAYAAIAARSVALAGFALDSRTGSAGAGTPTLTMLQNFTRWFPPSDRRTDLPRRFRPSREIRGGGCTPRTENINGIRRGDER
jgi:hypothetical protein